MTGAATVDDRYYEVAAPRTFAERVLVAARDRIYADFLAVMRPAPGQALLDIGVSDVITEGANLLERKYPHRQDITAVGLGEGESFRRAYPEVAYRRIEPGVPLPFADRAFAIATSNAVLEHVGSEAAQIAFIAEHARVAERAFLSVPNRFFPVEHHTGLPFAHWSDAGFALACRLTRKQSWADPQALILMRAARLRDLARTALGPGRRFRIGTTGLPLGPFSSNLFLAIEPG